MSHTIEDLLYDAHKKGKREELLLYLETVRQKNPGKELADLYQMAHDRIVGP